MMIIAPNQKAAYREFLLSPFWRHLSRRKIAAAGFKCERCPSTQLLQAHHLFYRQDWYQTQIEDLLCLCRKCHREEHGIKPPEPFQPKKRKFVRFKTWKKRLVKAGKWRGGIFG